MGVGMGVGVGVGVSVWVWRFCGPRPAIILIIGVKVM